MKHGSTLWWVALAIGCSGDQEDEEVEPVDSMMVEPDDTGRPDPETGMPSPSSSTVDVVPYLEGATPLGFDRFRAPDWFATFTETGWETRTLASNDAFTLETGVSGRFAIASACVSDSGTQITVFAGSTDDGDGLTLPGCSDRSPRPEFTSRVNVDDSLYDGGPESGRCGIVRYGRTTWLATCIPASFVNFNTVEDTTTALFAERYGADEVVSAVYFEGPIAIQDPGPPPLTLDFNSANAAPPAYVTLTPGGEQGSIALVTDYGAFSIAGANNDPGIPAIPTSLAPAGARYVVTNRRTIDGQPSFDTETVFLDAPPTTLEVGQNYEEDPPGLTVTQEEEGLEFALETAPDWATATVSVFTPTISWTIVATPGAATDQVWTVPAGADIEGLAKWLKSELGEALPKGALEFPSEGTVGLTMAYSRGEDATPFEVWRGQFFADGLAEGVRVVRQSALVPLE
ncbi:MAG: hypothetical protein AAGA48_12600 [Myxococcota bacterium]